MHEDDVTELSSEETSVSYFGRKEHCSHSLKRGRAWVWLLLAALTSYQTTRRWPFGKKV